MPSPRVVGRAKWVDGKWMTTPCGVCERQVEWWTMEIMLIHLCGSEEPEEYRLELRWQYVFLMGSWESKISHRKWRFWRLIIQGVKWVRGKWEYYKSSLTVMGECKMSWGHAEIMTGLLCACSGGSHGLMHNWNFFPVRGWWAELDQWDDEIMTVLSPWKVGKVKWVDGKWRLWQHGCLKWVDWRWKWVHSFLLCDGEVIVGWWNIETMPYLFCGCW